MIFHAILLFGGIISCMNQQRWYWSGVARFVKEAWKDTVSLVACVPVYRKLSPSWALHTPWVSFVFLHKGLGDNDNARHLPFQVVDRYYNQSAWLSGFLQGFRVSLNNTRIIIVNLVERKWWSEMKNYLTLFFCAKVNLGNGRHRYSSLMRFSFRLSGPATRKVKLLFGTISSKRNFL